MRKIAPTAIEMCTSLAPVSCAASMRAFPAGIKKAVVDACPEVTESFQVKAAGGTRGTGHFVNPFAVGDWLAGGTLDDIADGGIRPPDAGGVDVTLFRSGAAVTRFEDACSHIRSGISAGTITGVMTACPCHGNLASGEWLTAPLGMRRPDGVAVFREAVLRRRRRQQRHHGVVFAAAGERHGMRFRSRTGRHGGA
jgi:nitrite reductase/ring-hydroxylating ferredoxin subunit